MNDNTNEIGEIIMTVLPYPIAATAARLAINIDYWIDEIDGAKINVVDSGTGWREGRGHSWAEATRNFLINNGLE